MRASTIRRDRAGQFTASFDAVLADVGIQVVRIRLRCRRANCFAERFVRTIRTELTERILIFSQRHLRVLLADYVRHYNGRRPHRAATFAHTNRPTPPPTSTMNASRVNRCLGPNQRVRMGSMKSLLPIGADFWNLTGMLIQYAW